MKMSEINDIVKLALAGSATQAVSSMAAVQASLSNTVLPTATPAVPRVIDQFPHCDARSLHAPGVCRFCDRHPDWQELRALWCVPFSPTPNGAFADLVAPPKVEREDPMEMVALLKELDS
jgi:hypothetical protein